MEFALFIVAIWGIVELMYTILGPVIATATLLLLGEIVVMLIVFVLANKICDNIFEDKS